MEEELLNSASVDFIGSSGTLVASALETVGYFYQSILIDALGRGVAGSQSAFVSLGALFFIIGVLVVLVNVILLGRYKFSAWLLVGPSLFYASVLARIETSGSAWEFGNQLRNNELKTARVRDMLGREAGKQGEIDSAYKPKVSALFAWYNKLVSTTVNGMVDVIVQNKNEVDTSFFVRTQLYNGLGQSTLDNPGLRELVHESFFGQCRKQLEYGRKMRDERFSPVDRQWFADQYERLAISRVVEPKQLSKEYIAQVYAHYPALFKEVIVTTARGELNAARAGSDAYRLRVFDDGEEIKTNGASSTLLEQKVAKQATAMRDSAAQKEFDDMNLESIEGTTGRSSTVPGLIADEVDEANKITLGEERDGTMRNRESVKKFADNEKRLRSVLLNQARSGVASGLFTSDIGGLSSVSKASYNSGRYSCHEIWQIVFASLHWQGLVMLRQGLHQAREKGVEAGDQIRFLHDMMVATRYYRGQHQNATSARDLKEVLKLEDAIVNSIAKKIFKNEVRRDSLSSRIAAMTASINRPDHIELEQETSLEDLEAGRLSNTIWQERLKAASLIESMPYYQGLILYFLAVLFPFFAFLLLIPGKHSGFMLWFILWFWAKSWDVAFAVVMMLDDVLHAIFIKGIQFSGANTGLEKDLSLASLSIQEQDPTFNASIYYTVISVAFQAIPFVTSYLVIGALKGGGSIIAEGMERYASSDNVIGRVSGIAGVGRMAHEAGALWNVKADLQQRRVDAAQAYMSSDKGGAVGAESGDPSRKETSSLRAESNYLGQKLGVSALGDQFESSEQLRGFGDGMNQGGRKLGYRDLVLGMSRDTSQYGNSVSKGERRLAKRQDQLDRMSRTGPVTTGLQSLGNGIREWNSMKSATAMRSLESRMGLATTWANHDSTGDARSYKDAQAFILHGCIPIYSSQKVDHMQEATRIAAEYDNKLQYREGVVSTVAVAAEGAQKTFSSWENRGRSRR